MIGTGEHMNNTLIASKCVDRLIVGDDELTSLKDCIEQDFLGKLLQTCLKFLWLLMA